MTSLAHPLASLDAWAMAADSVRDGVLAAVVAALPGARDTGRAGTRGLATITDAARTWILVPGGAYRRGISKVEARHIEEKLRLREGQVGADHYRPWLSAVLAAADAVEVVRVRPLLVATKPVTARELGATLGRRVDRAWAAQLEERVPFAEVWGGAFPAIVPRNALAEVSRALASAGRILGDAEWEYLGRDGGTGTWVAAPDDARESALGLRGFGAPAWVEGGSGARGGGWDTYPWQDTAERLHTCAGARPSPEIDPHGRMIWLARDLPFEVEASGEPPLLDIERPPPAGPGLAALLGDLTSDDPVPWRRALGRLQKRAVDGDLALQEVVLALLAVVASDAEPVASDPLRRGRIAALAAVLAARWSPQERTLHLASAAPAIERLVSDPVGEVATAARAMRG